MRETAERDRRQRAAHHPQRQAHRAGARAGARRSATSPRSPSRSAPASRASDYRRGRARLPREAPARVQRALGVDAGAERRSAPAAQRRPGPRPDALSRRAVRIDAARRLRRRRGQGGGAQGSRVPVPGQPRATPTSSSPQPRQALADARPRKSPQGRELLLRLLPRFDVLVENFRPGVMEQLGLGRRR